MAKRSLLISAAICVAASYGAYYEQSHYDPLAEAAKERAVWEATAGAEAENAYRRCKQASPDESCNNTYKTTLQSARAYYGQHGGAYNVTHDTETRNLYLVVAVISGLVAFSQLRKRKRGSRGAPSDSRRVVAPAEVHAPSTSRSRATDHPQHSAISPQVPPTDDSKLVAAEGLWPATAPPPTHPQEHTTPVTGGQQGHSKRGKSFMAFPNLLFGALVFANFVNASSKFGVSGYAFGVAIGICLVPLALALAWNTTRGEARILKWVYVAATSLFGLVFVGAQIQESREDSSPTAPRAEASDVQPRPNESSTPAHPPFQSTPQPATLPTPAEANALPANSSPGMPSASTIEVPQLNIRKQKRPPTATADGAKPESEPLERPQLPRNASENVAYAYRDFPSLVALGTLDEVRDAIDRGANVNERFRGTIPLISAARHGRADIVELLLAHGAQVDTVDSNGRTAMFYAQTNASRTNADAATIAVLTKWGASNPFNN